MRSWKNPFWASVRQILPYWEIERLEHSIFHKQDALSTLVNRCNWVWKQSSSYSNHKKNGDRRRSKASASWLFYAWDAISFTTMAAGPVPIHFVCGETCRPAGNCFAKPVLVGRDVTAAIVVNEMRETAVGVAKENEVLAFKQPQLRCFRSNSRKQGIYV